MSDTPPPPPFPEFFAEAPRGALARLTQSAVGFARNSVEVSMARRDHASSTQQIRLWPSDQVQQQWMEVRGQERLDYPEGYTDTLTLHMDEAIALHDVLSKWIGNAPDSRTGRDDLLHERGRVDRLTDAIIEIAKRP